MITELSGLPGAGKSTLSKKMTAQPGNYLVIVKWRMEILLWLMLAFLFKPTLSTRHLLWCCKHKTSRFYLWNFYCVRLAKFSKASFIKGNAIIDEGPLQNLLSFPERELTSEEIIYFLSATPTSNRTILITVDEADRQKRLAKRPYQNWRDGQKVSVDWDKIMQHNYSRLVASVAGDSRYQIEEN